MTLFKGIGAAMVTPFDNSGNINYAVIDKYIEHLIAGGIDALIPFGTTGEPTTVTAAEREKAIKHIIARANGRVPVIVGAGSNSTAVAVEHVKEAKKLGADGVLVVTPYYNKCTQNGLIAHYKAVAQEGLPVIAYNVPSRTGVNIAPSTLKKLALQCGIVGIKEANGDIEQFRATASVCDECGIDFYSGDDGLTDVAMMFGAKGVISVAANPAPKLMKELYTLLECGDYKTARKNRQKLDEFFKSLFCEVNPIPVKKAMQFIGIDVGTPRLPLTELEPEHTERLKAAMREVGLL